MLKLTLEILPADGRPAKPIGTVEITNDETGDDERTNYDVVVRDSAGNSSSFRLEGAPRPVSPWALAADATAEIALHHLAARLHSIGPRPAGQSDDISTRTMRIVDELLELPPRYRQAALERLFPDSTFTTSERPQLRVVDDPAREE